MNSVKFSKSFFIIFKSWSFPNLTGHWVKIEVSVKIIQNKKKKKSCAACSPMSIKKRNSHTTWSQASLQMKTKKTNIITWWDEAKMKLQKHGKKQLRMWSTHPRSNTVEAALLHELFVELGLWCLLMMWLLIGALHLTSQCKAKCNPRLSQGNKVDLFKGQDSQLDQPNRAPFQ